RAGVVEFAGLPDDDRPGTDDQDAGEVGALRHRLATGLHESGEIVEEVGGVVGTGGGLGVVLHREGPQRVDPQPLHDAVVEVDVGDVGAGGDRIGLDGVVVVLAGDL